MLILLNGFFVLAEFAFVKVRSTQLEELVRSGNPRAVIARGISEDIDNYLSAIQLGITMASLGLGWVGEPSVGKLLVLLLRNLAVSAAVSHTVSFILAFTLITSLHVVIGEQVPKLVAIKNPAEMALFTAVPLRAFHFLTYLPMRLLNGAAYAALKLFGFRPEHHEKAHSEEELRLILGQTQEDGALSLGGLLMFENLFDFGHARVKSMMTPRDKVAFLSPANNWPQNLEIIRARRFTRYPVCEGTLDNTLGYLHLKDLSIKYMCDGNTPDFKTVLRKILKINENTPAEDALREFQSNRVHQALVTDAGGAVTGLLTLEDVVEELIGEIRDEIETRPVATLAESFMADSIVMELGSASHTDCIKELLQVLHDRHPVFNREDALGLVLSREKNLSTAMGNGTAFPHARLQGLAKPLIALGRRAEPIDFASLDKKPVHLVFLILTPYYEPACQLRILSQLAMLTGNQTLHHQLLRAETPAEIGEIIRLFETGVPEEPAALKK
ncbi:MAG: CNNM domain-containing protein [Elusimicrobiaceae bacterium]|nr:CNNM domain-containing protein [Elusimicrobiaceae bacterium]